MKRSASAACEPQDVKAVMLARLQKLKEARSCGARHDKGPSKSTVATANEKPRYVRPRTESGVGKPLHNFETDKDDHCETSDVAYDDIMPLLRQMASFLGKSCAELKIYDPYYCNGAVIKNLAARGFPKVYNRNEDFYQVIQEERVPEYDICVTNPPYSGDHVEKMLNFFKASRKPFFCLVPNYVYTKPYYQTILGTCRPFFVIPEKRYEFWTPGGFRKPSSREQKTSPFVSFWYCDGGEHTSALIKWWRKEEIRESTQLGGAKLIQNTRLLPQRVMATFDPRRRRLRKKQRIAIKKRQKSVR